MGGGQLTSQPSQSQIWANLMRNVLVKIGRGSSSDDCTGSWQDWMYVGSLL